MWRIDRPFRFTDSDLSHFSSSSQLLGYCQSSAKRGLIELLFVQSLATASGLRVLMQFEAGSSEFSL